MERMQDLDPVAADIEADAAERWIARRIPARSGGSGQEHRRNATRRIQ